jgi:hypothetical protein
VLWSSRSLVAKEESAVVAVSALDKRTRASLAAPLAHGSEPLVGWRDRVLPRRPRRARWVAQHARSLLHEGSCRLLAILGRPGSLTTPATPTAAPGPTWPLFAYGTNTSRESAAARGTDLDPNAGSRSRACPRKGILRHPTRVPEGGRAAQHDRGATAEGAAPRHRDTSPGGSCGTPGAGSSGKGAPMQAECRKGSVTRRGWLAVTQARHLSLSTDRALYRSTSRLSRRYRVWIRSPWGPKMASASAGPSTAPSQWGTRQENSAASPDSRMKSSSPSTSLSRPERT